jgi:hypothetical protein
LAIGVRILLLSLLLVYSLSPGVQALSQKPPPAKDWGPKSNTPGAQLTAKESDRENVERVTVITYQFSVTGLPKDKGYKFWIWELGSDPQGGLDVSLNEGGMVVSKADEKNGEPLRVKVFGVPAEPKMFALVSADGQSRAFTQVIPFPIESTDATCRLSVEMMAPLYTLVRVRVEGLQPGEEFQLTFQSGGEGGRFKYRADEHGRWDVGVAPYVKGKKEGFTEVGLSGRRCKTKVIFPWGVHYFQ